MKKTIIALLALAGVAGATENVYSYTWIGGDTITTEGWRTESNWQSKSSGGFTYDSATDSSNYWNTSGNGPATNGSNMWGSILIDGASGSVDRTIEGWGLKLTLKNGSNLTFTKLNKLQNSSAINIDSTSSLTFEKYNGGNDGNPITLNNAGNYTVNHNNYLMSYTDGYTMNLYGTGKVTFNGLTGTNAAKVKSIAAQLISSASGIQERTLITLSGENMSISNATSITYTFTDADGIAMAKVDSLDALTNATVSSYFVSNDSTGVKVSYLIVPEPTTATLSLLALAGLAARRRRR